MLNVCFISIWLIGIFKTRMTKNDHKIACLSLFQIETTSNHSINNFLIQFSQSLFCNMYILFCIYNVNSKYACLIVTIDVIRNENVLWRFSSLFLCVILFLRFFILRLFLLLNQTPQIYRCHFASNSFFL